MIDVIRPEAMTGSVTRKILYGYAVAQELAHFLTDRDRLVHTHAADCRHKARSVRNPVAVCQGRGLSGNPQSDSGRGGIILMAARLQAIDMAKNVNQ